MQLLWVVQKFDNMISVINDSNQIGAINIWAITGYEHVSRARLMVGAPGPPPGTRILSRQLHGVSIEAHASMP